MNNPYLSLDQQIVGDVYTSSEVMNNLTVLCDDFGSRFAGTVEEKQAADFILGCFQEYGLSEARLETYPYAGWSRGNASLKITAPIEREIPCISLPYCPSQSVNGELISVGFGGPDDFERLSGKLSDKIVLASSASSPEIGRWVHRKEKYERSVLAQAQAFIFVSEHAGVGPETGSLQNNRPAPIAGISISKEDGAFLQRLIDRKSCIQLQIETTDVNTPRISWNVVADLPAEGPDAVNEEQIVLGCHYDGHDISQGAHDPASGLVLMIESARVLAKYARSALKRTIRFIAFGTEEIGLTGAFQYVKAHQAEMDQLRFMYNLDAAGGSSRKGLVLHRWAELTSFFENAYREMSVKLPVGQKLHSYSDHFPFFLAGVPSGHMGDPESGPKGRGFGHTAYDTLEKIEIDHLRAGSAISARLALRMGADLAFQPVRRNNTSVDQIIAIDPGLEGYRVAQTLADQLSD